ncbi:MAG: ABC transporter ATP-binding protein [Bacteroidales bacterium]|nr:ABC transporter ATP-binding protein [Bacteroidales bacterium]
MKDFFKVLLRFVPPYKRFLILNILFNILSTVFSLFSFGLIIPILQILFKIDQSVYHYIPFGTGTSFKDEFINNFYFYVNDTINQHGGSLVLMLLGLILILMTLLKTGAAYLALYNMIPLRTGVVRDIRNAIFRKIASLPIGFFSNERKGDIIARMSGDVNEIENSIMSSLDMMFKNPIMIIVYLITMFALSWQLTIFVLILLPVSGYIMGTVGKKLKRTSLEGQQQWGILMSQIEETLGGLRIIKAFNAEGKIKARFEKQNNLFRGTTNRINRRQSLAHPMSEFLGTVTIAIVLWYGGTLILNNTSSINASSFIYYIVIFYSIINPAKDLSKAVYSIQKGLASMERVDKILAAKNTIVDPQNPVEMHPFSQKIEFKNVSFKYHNHWVLKDINLEIPIGKSIALVGQSGSGKSTLVDLIPRFYDVQKGEILIDGVNIRNLKIHDLRSLMGNVNQEAILFNDTFFNNIAFGVENATFDQVIEAAKIANAHDFIAATEEGYETNIGDRGGKLSGGQRQRLSIARAILKNPPVLILDEATSALDTESERLVQEAIENLMRNRTSIVIAHRLSTIKNADLICVMNEGEIVERGRHDELIALDGYYKRLCDMQSF